MNAVKANEFDRSLARCLVHEGGFSNHPKDPGGATMKGVTQRVYDDYRESIGAARISVRHISDAELRDIYRRRYWDAIKGDKMPAGVAYVQLDGAINSGPGQAGKWLQRALQAMGLYKLKIDGVIGDGTIKALRMVNDNDALIARICALRLAFMKALKTWATFRKGWSARVASVLQTGQAWASGSVGPAVEYIELADAKAFIESAKVAPSTAPGDSAAGAGVITATLTQAQDQLAPLTTIDFVAKIVTVLTVAGVVVTVGGLVYRTWAKRKAERLAVALDMVPE